MMEEGFQEWLDLQRRLQIESFGIDPRELEGVDRAEYVTWNAYALADELHEMTQEVKWKPWATGQGEVLDRERFIGEAVDLLHFLGNLLLVVDAAGVEVSEAYRVKHKVNRQRQEEGYDGITGKCPSCGRDLREVGTSRLRVVLAEDVVVYVTQCDACYYELERETDDAKFGDYDA